MSRRGLLPGGQYAHDRRHGCWHNGCHHLRIFPVSGGVRADRIGARQLAIWPADTAAHDDDLGIGVRNALFVQELGASRYRLGGSLARLCL